MAVSTVWIRDNMLGGSEQQERQLTEAELKVQRSLQKLSIPDWYLNKHSNPPKILSNTSPIESRPPSWKNTTIKKKSIVDTVLSSHITTGTYTAPRVEEPNNKINYDSGTYKVFRQPKLQENSRISPKSTDLDTKLPNVNLSTNISKTFPKVSPSRKIQNINIVFSPGPNQNTSSTLETGEIPLNTKYRTFVVKKQPLEVERDEKSNIDWETPKKRAFKNVEPSLDLLDHSFKTPNVKGTFHVRAVSTPRCKSPDFSSTMSEDSLEVKMCPNFFEETLIENMENTKKLLSQTFEKSLHEDTQRSPTNFLESRIRSIDPIIFERDDSALIRKNSVRQIVRKLDSKIQSERRPKVDTKNASPCTRLLNSNKKSTELENIVKSTQNTRKKGVVQGIIEELNEKVKSTLTRRNHVAVGSQNFVKTLVRALENGEASKLEEILGDREKPSSSSAEEEDVGNYSECDAKSAASSISLKDIDSSSDYDQRSPSLKSDDDSRFVYGTLETKKDQQIEENPAEEDSVYWIPVSRCKLPRTSSLLSMMSRLSTNGHQSPCFSPIRSDSECSDNSQNCAWGVTFKRTDTLSRKLFRIDETAITDSGYSERYGAELYSGSTSIVDSTWSEDTQNESESECKSLRFKKSSSRRKTLIGHRTFIV